MDRKCDEEWRGRWKGLDMEKGSGLDLNHSLLGDNETMRLNGGKRNYCLRARKDCCPDTYL